MIILNKGALLSLKQVLKIAIRTIYRKSDKGVKSFDLFLRDLFLQCSYVSLYYLNKSDGIKCNLI